MKKEKGKSPKEKGVFKNWLEEFSWSILFEVAWNIEIFIPKMIIRIIKNT